LSPADLVRFSAGALTGHRLRAGLSLLGVAIGVSSVILLTGLGEGARVYITGEFSALGTNLLMITPGKNETTGGLAMRGLGVPRDLKSEDVDALRRRVPQLRLVVPLALGQVRARYGERERVISVAGTTSDWAPLRGIHMRSGRYLPEGLTTLGQRICVLGPTLEKELFAGESALGKLIRLGDERFRVIGVWAPRGVALGQDLDEIAHIPVEASLRMFDRSGLSEIHAEVSSHDEIEPARTAVLRVLTERHEGVEDVTVTTQGSIVGSFTRILAMLTTALVGIATISLSVAGIGIMNVMLVSVSERTREIGLLKALGVSRAQVVSAFLVEASLLSTAGGILGIGFGYGTARLMKSLYPTMTLYPPEWAVGLALIVSVSVGLVFGVLPAWRASRLDPVTALARR
jgi:putative ABC transport system permease protein